MNVYIDDKKVMRKILTLLVAIGSFLLITACGNQESNKEEHNNNNPIEKHNSSKGESEMQISIRGENDENIIFQLNDSPAAKSLYDQLPISIDVENFGNNEKIFYPPQQLDLTDATMAKGPSGTLAYYAPWGNVAIYYGECGGASGLYALGDAISGVDKIESLSGIIQIEKHTENDGSKDHRSQNDNVTTKKENQITTQEENEYRIQITIGTDVFYASLYDNAAVRELMDRLPMTLEMDDLHNNEKFFYFSESLPTEEQHANEIREGDIKLFGSDCLVLFYKDFTNSYSYTSLGRIDNPQGLAAALGSGTVQVHFEQMK